MCYIINVMNMFSNELVCNIIDYINQHLDEEIRIDNLARLFYFNRTYIMKRFKKELGISIVKYCNTVKIYNSLRDLKYDKSILEIALKNGFNSQEYYSEIFKTILGVPPLTYKKYITYICNISKKQTEIIQNNIIEVELIISNVQKYLNNRKPQTTVKRLSLFQ